MKLLEFPMLHQTYEYDCGAAVLQSMLIYYGIELKEGVMMKEVKTSKTGTTITNIEKAAKKYGLKIDSRKMDILDLKKYIDTKIPVIVLLQAWGRKKNWQDKNFYGHYVIAIGYDSEKIYFADTDIVSRDFLTFKELNRRWHDVIHGKEYNNHGIALFGKKVKFDSTRIIPMG